MTIVSSIDTSPSSEGEDGERSEPGGGAVKSVSENDTAPPSTSLRSATSPSQEGEESKVWRIKRTQFAQKLAKKLRKQQTEAEKRLWYFLHKRQLDGLRFKRQAPLGNYVADFFCPSLKLIIEVDGGQHGPENEHDAERSQWLEAQGYAVVRFWNRDVMQNIEGVLLSIRSEVEYLKVERSQFTAPPSTSLRSATSPSKEGEE